MNTPEKWTFDETTRSFVRKFQLRSFRDSLDFVNKVGKLAEEVGHHPDITISYTIVTLTLTTHDAGGVTEKDAELALKINKLSL
jgi:4a-hydroxytetrahydrobiopterin dehydratase